MNGRSQTGIVAVASIDDYMNNVIKKHENTRVEKELDRIRFNLLEEVGQEKPFADHIIYGYIIAFQMKDRWMTQSDEAGMKILENIINGNY